MGKKEEVEFHKYANIFPLMSNSNLEDLAKDIKKNGLLDPIILYKGKILDGRNRFLACKKAKIEPEYRIFNKNIDPIEYIISKNLQRRHLTSAQKAESAKKALDYKRQTRERQFEQLKGDSDELDTLKKAVDIKDKKDIAQKYRTTVEKIEQYEEIEKEIEKDNKKIKEDWEKAKKGKKTPKEVYEVITNKRKEETQKQSKGNLRGQLREAKYEIIRLQNIQKQLIDFIKEMGIWDEIKHIFGIINTNKSLDPTPKQRRKAELL